jgi:Protein of unknown function (DUF3168)
LHAWSRQGGQREAHLIAGALLQALDDAPLTLADNHLVNFRFALADVRREPTAAPITRWCASAP